VHQWHHVVDEDLLRRVLASPEPRARAAAVRVLGYWRDRVTAPLELLRVAANDEAPRVRLEAVRVASFFDGRGALEVACEVLKHDTDYYLEYTADATLRVLQPSPADLFVPSDPRARRRVLARLSNSELLRAPEIEPVWIERLERGGIELSDRVVALDALATSRGSDRIREAMRALEGLDAREDPAAAPDLGLIVAGHPASDLEEARDVAARLTRMGRQEAVRRAAWAIVVAADGGPERAWIETETEPRAREALIDSVLLHLDHGLRGAFQPLLSGLIAGADVAPEIRRAAIGALPLMGLDHAEENFGLLLRQFERGVEFAVVARAVLQLPRESWSSTHAGRAAETIRQWAGTVPLERRTAAEFIETVQLGLELADWLPVEDATRLRRELLGLGVRVFSIKAVREQMRYDVTRIVVEAGEPFEIHFENIDMMPHNLVIVEPGAREEIGRLADAMSPRPDRQGRAYVPGSSQVLAATRMLESGESETLRMTAPSEPGEYEYVCTYPEHWMAMFGRLVVVRDLESYVEAPVPAAAPVSVGEQGAHRHH
jgi:plastocyanin